MLEYLFDSDYKAAKSKYDTANSKRNKLIKIKQDITNDSSSINTINHNLDYIYEDFAKAIRISSIRSRVSTKLSALKEPYQTSDGNLRTACGYIDAECSVLKKQMDTSQSTMNSIKNGGAGSW